MQTPTPRQAQAAWDILGDTEMLRFCPMGISNASAEQLTALIEAASA